MASVVALKRQLALVLEAGEGVENTSVAAADLLQVMNPEIEFLPNVFDRPIVSESFGVLPQFHATMAAEIRFEVEIAGSSKNSSSWTTSPLWSRALRCCGFIVDEIRALAVTSGTITGGPIQHGETLTETTSGATAVAVGQWRTGATTIYVRNQSATFTGNLTVTGGTSGATFTSKNGGTSAELAGAAVGFAWIPTTTEDPRTCTIHFYQDTEKYIFYGCRGTAEFDLRVHDRGVIRFTFRGIFKSVTGSSTLLDSSLTNVYPTRTPPAYVNAAASLTDSAGSLSGSSFVFNQLTLNVGNDLVMRESANGAQGYLAAVVNDREPTCTLSIEQPGATDYDFVTKNLAGTIQSLDTSWGTATYNSFRIKADHLEIANIQPGENAQRATWEVQGRLTRGFTSGVDETTPGQNNELILYHT